MSDHPRVILIKRIEELRHPCWVGNVRPGKLGWKDAPVLIIVCADPRTFQASAMPVQFFSGQDGGFGAVFFKNMANATQNMHLAAVALGLGSQWFTIWLAYGGLP
jgi:nitroreductase